MGRALSGDGADATRGQLSKFQLSGQMLQWGGDRVGEVETADYGMGQGTEQPIDDHKPVATQPYERAFVYHGILKLAIAVVRGAHQQLSAVPALDRRASRRA